MAVSRISSVSSTSTSQTKSWQDQFSFQEVCLATSNFSEQNKIGKGNFGTVYKAKLRDGSIIAVKRAKKVSGRLSYHRKFTSLLINYSEQRNE